MPGTVTVEGVVEAHIGYIDARVEIFKADMRTVANTWRRLIVDDLLGNDYHARTTAEQISQISRELITQLNKAGYYDVAADFMSSYTESERFAQSLARLSGPFADPNVVMGSTPLPSNLVQQLRDFDYRPFVEEIGPGAARVIARELTLSAVASKKRTDILASVEGQLDSFVESSSSYADTALRSFDRSVCLETWTEAGIDRFRYFGPADDRNREFCRSHVGRIYDLAQIKALRNGAGRWGDVLRYGGGIRCRHTWSPIVSEPAPPREEYTGPSQADMLREERARIKAERKAIKRHVRDNADLYTRGIDLPVKGVN